MEKKQKNKKKPPLTFINEQPTNNEKQRTGLQKWDPWQSKAYGSGPN